MKWTYSIKHKITTASLLFGVILVVLLINSNQRKQIEDLKSAFETIYRDRLVAESYILDFSEKLHDMYDVINDPHLPYVKKQEIANRILGEIDTLNHLYEATRLTEEEARYFGHFTGLTHEMDIRLQAGDLASEAPIIRSALLDLNSLSEIQLVEADKLKSETDKIFSMGSILLQFEMVVLIVIGLLIQALFFASKTSKGFRIPKNPNLN
ncbi:MCP four helix bundle domain-containing protein [Cyclobacterium lianum]|nr:hypothetical protein [Cyclobacterium lianum]